MVSPSTPPAESPTERTDESTDDALGVTAASIAALGASVVDATARRAAELGFSSFWVAETVGHEAWATLAAVGAANPTMDLGTGVLALELRTPQLTAMGAATLQERHPDRIVWAGIGVSSPVVVGRWHGTSYPDRPLTYTRAFLTALRASLSGEPVKSDDPFFPARGFRLGVRLGDRRPRILLGALNQKMLRLAGELADGVLLNYLPASAVPWCVEQVRAGEAGAGRQQGSCEVLAYVHVGVADREAALPSARRDLFSYAVVDAYATAFRRAGFDAEVDAVRRAHADRDRDAAIAAVSDSMVDAIDIVGDADHVRAAIADYRSAGVDHPIVMPMPWGADRLAVIEATLDATAPRP